MKKVANGRKLRKQAEQLAQLLRLAGEPEAEVQRRVQSALERAGNHSAKREPAMNRFSGCLSVTDTAKTLGVTRGDLFAWLERAGWLCCGTYGWQATDSVIAAGWAVMRGPHSMRWPQLTQAGAQEIARRLGMPPEPGERCVLP